MPPIHLINDCRKPFVRLRCLPSFIRLQQPDPPQPTYPLHNIPLPNRQSRILHDRIVELVPPERVEKRGSIVGFIVDPVYITGSNPWSQDTAANLDLDGR